MMDELRARQCMYNLLATLFRGAPEPETIAVLQSEPVLAVLENLSAGEPGTEQILQQLRNARPEELGDRLAIDYTMLFSAPGSTQVPSYESVYRDKLKVEIPAQPEIDYAGEVRVFEGLFWGDSTVSVAGEYATEGFTPGDQIPDSLSLELAFMAHLCDRQLAFLEAGDAAAAGACAYREIKFLKEHLLQWVPTFTERVRQHRPESFYALGALLIQRFLETEALESI